MISKDIVVAQNEFLHKLVSNYGIKCPNEIILQYQLLMDKVAEIICSSSNHEIDNIREILFCKSGISQAVADFVLRKSTCAGMVFTYGTTKYQEVLVCGNQQEIFQERDGTVKEEIIPMSENSIFDLASVTKIITCMTIMRLCEKGIIDIKKKVKHYDKRFKNIAELTLENLMSFTPTLRTSKRIDQLEKDEALQELFNVTFSEEYNVRPYSDMGAMVLKYIVESATNQNFADIVECEILSNIVDDGVLLKIPQELMGRVVNNNFERKIISNIFTCDTSTAIGVVHDPKARLLEPDKTNICGHAGVFATAHGMADLSTAVLKGRILNEATLKSIGTNRIGFQANDGRYSQYLGLLCHTKHPLPLDSEVYTLLSEKTFAIGGYTGNHYMLDYPNGIFSFFATNRCHNRITVISNSEDTQYSDENKVLWPDGNSYRSAPRFAWDRDDVIHKANDYSIQLAFLDYFYSDKIKGNKRKVRDIQL